MSSLQTTDALLDVEDLRVAFAAGGREIRAVDGVSYQVDAGRTLAIIGESGSGKTVGCRAIMGLLPGTAAISGSARLRGTEMIGLCDSELRRHRGQDMAMIFQDPARSLNPTMRVGAQITEAIRTHRKVSKSEARAQAVELLRLVRIPAAERRFHEYPHQLSGGMRQRIMIAMALACRPKLLIADEATTALDVTTQAQIMELLLELQAELGMGLILISHDLGLAASYADEVVVMYAGKIVEQAPAKRLFGAGGTVKMRYTRALLDAIPHLERAAHADLPVVSGRPPDPTALPRRLLVRAPLPGRGRRLHGEGAGAGRARRRAPLGLLPPLRERSERMSAPTSATEPLLSVRDLVQEFVVRGAGGTKGGVVQAVSGVSFDIMPGETLGIVGETGSGKSTLARAVLQAPRPKSGSVVFRGADLTTLRGGELLAGPAAHAVRVAGPVRLARPQVAGAGRSSRSR